MARLKITSFEEAQKIGDSKIGHNTYLREEDGHYVVSLHGNDIVKLYRDRVEFTLAGWPTTTTRDRVNQFLPSGNRVFQRNQVQYFNGTSIDSDEWCVSYNV